MFYLAELFKEGNLKIRGVPCVQPLPDALNRSALREPLKMPSVAFLEAEMKKFYFLFPSLRPSVDATLRAAIAVQIVYPDDLSFSSTYVLKNGSISIMLHGHL
ncbi:MAG: hypothetical protein OXD47_08220 [Gammaproteobacteria bacterium]|nr:hypothetical protein [Gammaproteobacteria bacterium]MCY4338769.1 hypothetical protein [Gammaproteobacteria bacterium]